MRSLVVALWLACLSSVASADALGGCPEGQTFRPNPVQPGAMHHSGGECVPDGGGSGCAVSTARRDPSALVSLAGLVAIAGLALRRGKVRAR